MWIFWIRQSYVRDDFDRKVMVGRPDVQGSEEILKVHAEGETVKRRDRSAADRADNGRIYRSGSGKSVERSSNSGCKG